MALRPHVLFVLDDYSEIKGGAYALERSLIQLIQKCSENQCTISCITCGNDGATVEDATPIPRNIRLITPSKNETTVEDLNERDLQYYRNLENDVIGVTHVVIFSSHTIRCALSGGLVERVVNCNTARPRVIVINNDHTATMENLNGLKLSENNFKPLYISLAGGIFDRSKNMISHLTNSGTYHLKLYPYFEQIREITKLAPLPPIRSIITFVQGCFKQENECLNSNIDLQMLVKTSQCIEKLEEELKANDSRNEIKWVIYSDTCNCSITKKELVKNIENQIASTSIDYQVEILSDLDKHSFDKTLSITNLCIANGNFCDRTYSGLETLLSGIPTFVLKDSDTFKTIKEVNEEPMAVYFSLDEKDDNTKWLESFRSMLNSRDNIVQAFKHARELAYKYYKYSAVKESLQKFAELFLPDARIENIWDPIAIENRQGTGLPPQRYPSTTEDPLGAQIYHNFGIDIRPPFLSSDPNETHLKFVDSGDETLPKEHTDGFIQSDGPPSEQEKISVFERLELLSAMSPTSPTPVFNDPFLSLINQGAKPKSHYYIPQRNAQMSSTGGNQEEQPFQQPAAHSSRSTNARSLGESDNSSSDDSDNSKPPLPRVSTPPLAFTTKKQPRSSLSKKINKIKRESQKPVKKK